MKNDKTDFWSYLGQGMGLFLLCIGIGSCSALVNKRHDVPIIQINSTLTLTNSPTVVK